MRLKRRRQYVVLRRKVKAGRRRSVLVSALWIIAVSGAGFALFLMFDLSYKFIFNSSFFTIKNIAVSGVHSDDSEKIIGILGIKKGDNIFSFSAKDKVKKLKGARPEIRRAAIARTLPDKLGIDIAYRDPAARITFGERTLFVDEEGVVFTLPDQIRETEEADMPLPEIIAAGESERKILLRFLVCMNALRLSLGRQIVKLQIEMPLDIVYYLADGTKIAWGAFDEDRFSEKFMRLKMVYDDALKRFEHIQYVNARYWDDGRILVRPEEETKQGNVLGTKKKK